jgi:pimeloyl-ACP methyl ester carboxylesterase
MSDHPSSGDPPPSLWRSSISTILGAAFDRTMTATLGARVRRAREPGPDVPHAERIQRIAAIEARYAAAARRDFFAIDPGRPLVQETSARTLSNDIPMTDLRWTPRSTVIDPALREAIVNDPHSGEARARWIGGRESKRPVILLVHGYLGGDPKWEQRMMPVETLLGWGFDLALYTLPFHGPRKDPSRGAAPKFPAVDPAFNIEVFRQAIVELRELVQIARDRGAPSVGVLGMSLGGYTAALLAAAEPRLAFCVPMIPLASLADFARDHGRLPGTPDEQSALHAALDRVMAPVSPVHQRSLLSPERITILAARGDRITPTSHAERIARHTGGAVVTFEGGHLLQFGRSTALAALRERLRAVGAA